MSVNASSYILYDNESALQVYFVIVVTVVLAVTEHRKPLRTKNTCIFFRLTPVL